MKMTEVTIHCPAKECADRLWQRNEDLFKTLTQIRDILYKKDPDFVGEEWDLLDYIEALAFGNQPDICDITYELTK